MGLLVTFEVSLGSELAVTFLVGTSMFLVMAPFVLTISLLGACVGETGESLYIYIGVIT